MSVARRRAAFVTGLVAALALMAGCASSVHGSVETAAPQPALSEVHALEDPHAYEGPSTAVLPAAQIEPIAQNPEQQLPTTVTSYTQAGDEEQVEITGTDRVVAVDLAGSIAASIWALGFGGTLVGVDQSTTFPGTEDLDQVTSGGHTVNAESIIALAPDVVITDGTVGPRDVIEQLRDVGITVVFVDNAPSFDGAGELVRQVAAVYGAPEAGKQLAERIGQEIDDTVAEVADLVPDGESDRLRMLFLYL
ncbi:MAG: ABC transporter substrate-binding protein, partial [Microbacterium sp.]